MTTAGSSHGPIQTSYETEVIERSSGQAVKALILADLTADQIADTEALWTPARRTSRKKAMTGDRTDLDDLDWDWCKKHLVSAPGAARVFGLKVTDQFEGLMMTSNAPVRGRSSKTSGQELLYIEYLETAPRNQKSRVGSAAVYKDVGTQLIFAAMAASVDFGCGGRLALHSLSTAKTFYQVLSFEDIGFDKAEGLHYFELNDDGVKSLLGDVE